MRLSSFQIEHVKSIVDSGTCHMSGEDNLLVLAGQNEAGKSAILEALNYFGNGPDEKFIKLSKRLNVEPKVVCTFLVEEKDLHASDEEVNNVLRVLKTVECCRNGTAKDDDGFYTSDSTDEQIRKEMEKIDFAQRVLDENTEQEPEARNTALEKNKSEFFDAVVSHIIDSLPAFVFYDSFEGLLPGEIKTKDIQSSQAVQDFQKIFKVDFADAMNKNPQERTAIKNAIQEKAELDLNTYWSQTRLENEPDHYRFDINLIPGPEPKVEFLIHREDGVPLFMEQKSKGFQWFNAFILRLKAIGVEKEDFSNYVLLIDEPGQGLHESAQKNVKTVLEELAKKGMLILYTTHNPSLIGVNDDEILRIRLVYQSKEKGTKINTIAQFASSQEGASKDALSPIITAMGISHLGQIVDANKRCIVLEGITDHYYFSAFKQLLGINKDLAFIPACGVKNVRPLVSVLIGWGTDFKAVFDDGKDGRSVYRDLAKHLFADDEGGLHKSVRKLDSFEGIEDLFSKKDFYERVIGETEPEKSALNSEVAKSRKKELIARLFLEKVKKEKIHKKDFETSTVSNFSNVFDWIAS